MGEDAVERPKEMLGKEGDVYKLSIDTEPSGRNNLGWEGHLYIKQAEQSEREMVLRGDGRFRNPTMDNSKVRQWNEH